MKSKWFIIIGSIIIIAAGIGLWLYLQPKPSSPAPQTPKPSGTQTMPAQTTSPVSKPSDIHATDPAQLLYASYSRNLNSTTRWGDSPVSVIYRDFNGDNVPDAFIWAKIPGTAGNSFATVWTTDANGKPVELWYLQEQFYLGHSTWSVDNNNGLVNTSINADGSTANVNTFHWQVTSTGKGFVLEPNM